MRPEAGIVRCMGKRYDTPPRHMPPRAHGTKHGYVYYRCRCARCTAANTASQQGTIERLRAAPPPAHVEHGTANAYGNYRCRCDRCKGFNASQSQLKRAKARALREAA